MNWFEEWFDSPLYEQLYADRDEDEARQLIEFLEHRLSLDSTHYILDLGCGRGRHSIHLAKRGYRVKGIDLSKSSIEIARERAEKENLGNVAFEIRDMRNPLPERFDAVMNLFTTFGYFKEDEENLKVLRSVSRMLKKDGIFVLDYLNAKKVKKSFVPTEEGEFNEIRYDINRYIKDNAIHKDIEFDGEDLEEPKKYSERVKLYGLDWFKSHLGEYGLTIEEIYGNYNGGEYVEESSPRLILVSRYDP